jgi:putative PIN family toxin of toxin-antitoxin system
VIVVADTNVYVSALVFGGVPQAALYRALIPPHQLAISESIREEISLTLRRKFGWAQTRIDAIFCELLRDVVWVTPANVRACRDPLDDHILGCAVAAQASYLVTGDGDLLSLEEYRGIAIVTPVNFLSSSTSG